MRVYGFKKSALSRHDSVGFDMVVSKDLSLVEKRRELPQMYNPLERQGLTPGANDNNALLDCRQGSFRPRRN